MTTTTYLAITVVAIIIFIQLRMVWAAALFGVGFVLYILFRAGSTAVQGTAEVATTLATDIAEEVEASEGSHGAMDAVKGSLQETGRRAGDYAYSTDSDRFVMKPWGTKLGEGAKGIVQAIKDLFG